MLKGNGLKNITSVRVSMMKVIAKVEHVVVVTAIIVIDITTTLTTQH